MDRPQDYRELANWYRSSAELAATRSGRRECVELALLMDELAIAQEMPVPAQVAPLHFA
jgi:hypothetical protein